MKSLCDEIALQWNPPSAGCGICPNPKDKGSARVALYSLPSAKQWLFCSKTATLQMLTHFVIVLRHLRTPKKCKRFFGFACCQLHLCRCKRSLRTKQSFVSSPLPTKKDNAVALSLFWCGQQDLNLHSLATIRTWILRVCQFRHARLNCYRLYHFCKFLSNLLCHYFSEY